MIHNQTIIKERPAPSSSVGAVAWLRANLFNGPINTIFTLIGLYILYLLVVPTVQWAFLNADWIGTTRDDCSREGACWVFINARFTQFIYGLYPREEIWRANIVFAGFFTLIAWLAIPRLPLKRWVAIFALVGFPIVAYVLLHGGYFDMPRVPTHRWGGLLLTLLLATVGMVGALPIGIVLALGRRSNMPIVKSFCVVFIEFWRRSTADYGAIHGLGNAAAVPSL